MVGDHPNPMKGRGTFWTLPKHWKLWQVILWKHWTMYKEKETPSGGKGFSFKEFYKNHFPMFKGNLNSRKVREWLASLEELLQVMDCIDEQRVKYVAFKISEEGRRWWYAKRNSLVVKLRSEEAIMWT